MLLALAQVKHARHTFRARLRRAGRMGRVRGFSVSVRRLPAVIPALFMLLNAVIGLLIWALILAAVFSTLASFGVLDTRNRLVWTVGDFLHRVTEPLLRPVRNIMPNFGSVDLSPIAVILLLQYVARPLLATIYTGLVTGSWTLM